MQLKCPHDNEPLTVRQAEGHIGYLCESCRGVWLPKRYLETIKHSHEYSAEYFLASLRSQQSIRTTLPCPQGCGPLESSESQQIRLESCGACDGVWLDSSELRLLLAQFKKYPSSNGSGETAAADGAALILFSLF